MDGGDLEHLRDWFAGYIASFNGPGEEDRRNFQLKVEHTYNVCQNIALVAGSEGLGEGDVALAEAVGLLHDVGRFPQYAEFRTFRDDISLNHGKLGVRVLEDEGILDGIDERELILDAVKYHNASGVPGLGDPRKEMFIKLLRDADKLDIWRVVIEGYALPPEQRASAIGLGLPEEPGYNEEIISVMREGRVLQHSMVENNNDFLLLQLSWIYDLNFRESFRLALERDCIGGVAAFVPKTPEVAEAVSTLRRYAANRAA
jgi:hypothetical protein